jgi:hypothetical protein
MHRFSNVSRWNLLCLVLLVGTGCRSAQLRGPGPYNPSAMGYPGSRAAEMAPGRNSPSNFGWGSAYDPHTPGSRANTGSPGETGSIPPLLTTPFPGRPMGVPPPVTDDRKR